MEGRFWPFFSYSIAKAWKVIHKNGVIKILGDVTNKINEEYCAE